MLLFSIVGWAVSVALDGRKLHCGGTQQMDAATKNRYKWYVYVLFGLLVVCPVSLATESWLIYYPSVLATVGFLVGEIGWGSPWKAFGWILPESDD